MLDVVTEKISVSLAQRQPIAGFGGRDDVAVLINTFRDARLYRAVTDCGSDG